MTTRSPTALRVVALALVTAALALGVLAPSPARAQATAGAAYDPFAQSRVRLSVRGGISSTGDDTYLTLGVGAGYYLLDGLELGLDTDFWFLGDPEFLNVTPGLLYVVPLKSIVRPYIGPFYRHAFVFGDYDDLDSLGGHAGVFFAGGRTFFGVGAVYEHFLGCDDSDFVDCDVVYPELVLAFSF